MKKKTDYWLARIDTILANRKISAQFYEERAESRTDVCISDGDGSYVEYCSQFWLSQGDCCDGNGRMTIGEELRRQEIQNIKNNTNDEGGE